MNRDYSAIAKTVTASGDLQARMQQAVDALWDGLHATGVSWVGFYTPDEIPDTQELRLAARRDKPACSPIGLHGACGQCFLTQQPLVVRDVKELGEGYVACDPRDQSEVVIPCFDGRGTCWGVLDLDSFDIGAFTENDVQGLTDVLIAAGLTTAKSRRN
ncbi:MAG: GAF domain-containing protein [Phycisphaerae bacterium]